MYILTITYPKSKDATFDFDYYRTKHLPEVGRAFGPFGLGYASVLRGEESLDGGDPAYFATVILSFSSEQGARDAVAADGAKALSADILSFATEQGAREAVVADAAKALSADIANFTSVTPIIQFNTAVP